MKIYLNGTIHTLDPAQPRVEALACDDGRVVALGRSDELRPLARSVAEVVDLQGHAAVPGFIDAHIHLLNLGLSLSYVDLEGAVSLRECLERVARYLAAPPGGALSVHGGWIVGRGWNRNDWLGRREDRAPADRWPGRDDLDAVTGDRPTVLASHDGHLAWANSAALRAAGITRETPDPPGGELVRNVHGEPAGVLKENATQPLYAVLPAPDPDALEAALLRAMAHALRLGVTGVGTFERLEVYRACQRLRARGRLGLRVVAHVALAELDQALDTGIRSGQGDVWLRHGSLKLFADGTLGSLTAAMIQPFAGTDTRGIATLSAEQMGLLAKRAANSGIATAIHAIGDRANRAALDALDAAPRVPAMPHRVEHVQLLHPDDLPRFSRHGIVASMQPIHMVGDRDTAARLWGDRCATAYAWRPLWESGAMLAFGSDAPIESCDPLLGLYAAVARHGRDDGRASWYPALALTVEQGLWAYTVGAATATGEEDAKGSLAVGHVADLAVLSHNVIASPEELEAARVVCTIVGGEIVGGGLGP